MNKPVCLIGFMGVGKSRWGKQLANKLEIPFVDLDKLIEAKAGMTIPEIFKGYGEDFFRQLESETLEEILLQNDLVASLGGGTPCSDKNIELLMQKAFTIYLKSNAGMLHSRLINNYKSRPLLALQQEENLLPFIQNLLTEREKYYHQADVIIDVERLTIEKLIKTIS